MASKREGLPRSTMETMASELPCIVSKIKGNTDLIDNGSGGYLVPLDDAEIVGFATSINRLLDNTILIKEIGIYNRNNILNFDSSVIVRQMLEIFKVII